MMMSEWLNAFRRFWWAVLASILLVGGAALALTASTPKQYESSSSVFFYVGDAANVTELNEGTVYAQYQLQSYAKLVAAPSVLEPVIEQQHLDMDVSTLASKISVVAPQQLTLLTITVTDDKPDEAWRISQAVAKQLQTTVAATVPKAKSGVPMLESKLIADSAAPTAPSSPNMKVNLALGLLGGLALGALLAAALQLRSRHAAARSTVQAGSTAVEPARA